MKNSLLNFRLPKLLGVSVALACSGAFTSCSDDLLTGTPEWLGSSIYEELASRGNFTTMLKLIEHPAVNQAEVLKRTGSRTVFAADDKAWQEFFEKNASLPENDPWANATSFEKLTSSQARVLYKSNVLKNAYLIGLLGNVAGTEYVNDNDGQAQLAKNQCLRHVSGSEPLDSVVVFYNDENQTFHYPTLYTDEDVHKYDYWAHVRHRDSIRTMNGADDMPMMVHLTPGFINYNMLTREDIVTLTGDPNASVNKTIVNGAVVDDSEELRTYNVTCQNGYIHMLTKVAMPASSMAQIIDTRNDMKIFRSLLDRFSFPYFDKEVSEIYNNYRYQSRDIKDSIYIRRYFNNNNGGHSLNNTEDDREGVAKIEAGSMVLPYDPAWNQNITVSGNNKYTNIPVMIVPTDDVLNNYLQTQFSKYSSWDEVPDNMILPIIKECMRTSFLVAPPSRVDALKNSSSQDLGLQTSDITACYFGSNGVIYAINKAISAPDYLSVYAPVLMNSTEQFSTLHNFITEDDDDYIKTLSAAFKAYLNNFPTRKDGQVKGNLYTFLAPSNSALMKIYDPATRLHETSAGQKAPVAYSFYYDKRYDIVRADIFRYNVELQEETGEIQKDESLPLDIQRTEVSPDYDTKMTRSGNLTSWINSPCYHLMVDILDNNIVTSLLNDEQKFYKTKAGSPLYYDRYNGFAGGYQLQFESPRYITPDTYTEHIGLETGNGNTFELTSEPVMPTDVSPYQILNSKFAKFTELIKGRTNPKAYLAINDMAGSESDNAKCTQDYALQMLSNYNYTIYAPTDKTIDILQNPEQGVEKGGKKYILPSWKWIETLTRVKASAKGDPADTASINRAIDSIRFAMDNFITYHIQDNSVYLQGADVDESYETSCLDKALGKFKSLNVAAARGGDEIRVTDETGKVHIIKLSSDDDRKSTQMHNLMTRQCFFNSKKPTNARYVDNSAYVVIHGLTNDAQGPDYLELDYDRYLFSIDYYNYLKALVEKYGQTL